MNQKRYYTEEEILKAIDRTTANKKKAADRADRLDQLASSLFQVLSLTDTDKLIPELMARHREQRLDAERAREKAERIRSYQQRYVARLNRLKRTLAAFQTVPMPFVEQAVVLQ